MTMRKELRLPADDRHDLLSTGTDCMLKSLRTSSVQSNGVLRLTAVPASTFDFDRHSFLILKALAIKARTYAPTPS